MSLDRVKCYSIYPSEKQGPHPDPHVEVFKLNHPIPICESVSPVSNYRWHSMSVEEVSAYLKRLEDAVHKQMEQAEQQEGTNFSLAIAHHTFFNTVVLRNVLKRRKEEGKPKTVLTCFVHGTALKMYEHEKKQQLPQEFPLRFLPFMEKEKILDSYDRDGVQLCFVVSRAQVETFLNIFPSFPKERVIFLETGINQLVFHEIEGCTVENTLSEFSTVPYEGSKYFPVKIDGSKYDNVVLIVAKLAKQKRIPALLYAAQKYEKSLPNTATLIVGTGPTEAQKELQDMAFEQLKLQSTFFLGPQSQPTLAKLYTIASVGVLASYEEAFGMVLVECMACGTPVIAANSGGPKDFVNESVGCIISEPQDPYDCEELSIGINVAVERAIKENWKGSRKAACKELVRNHYSVARQCSDLITTTRKVLNV